MSAIDYVVFAVYMVSPAGAMAGILVGGTTTLVLSLFPVTLPWELPATAFGIAASAAAFVLLTYLVPKGVTSTRPGQYNS